jgi:hypothetical protein
MVSMMLHSIYCCKCCCFCGVVANVDCHDRTAGLAKASKHTNAVCDLSQSFCGGLGRARPFQRATWQRRSLALRRRREHMIVATASMHNRVAYSRCHRKQRPPTTTLWPKPTHPLHKRAGPIAGLVKRFSEHWVYTHPNAVVPSGARWILKLRARRCGIWFGEVSRPFFYRVFDKLRWSHLLHPSVAPQLHTLLPPPPPCTVALHSSVAPQFQNPLSHHSVLVRNPILLVVA